MIYLDRESLKKRSRLGAIFWSPPDPDTGNSKLEFWLPIKDYKFDDRIGLNTVISLYEKREEGFNYMQMGVFAVYNTEDMSKLNALLVRINRLNDRSKIVKWCLTSGKNREEAEDIRVHVTVEIPLDGGELSKEQFWRSHAAIWWGIESSWEGFAEDLGIRTQPKIREISQKEPEDLSDADKERLVEMLGKYLDEQFENS